MVLLVVVLQHEEVLDEVLSTLVELELPDSIVIDSRSGLEVLERDLPIFAGLRSLVPGGIEFHRTVLCLIEKEDVAQQAIFAITSGKNRHGGHGVVFLLPVTQAVRF